MGIDPWPFLDRLLLLLFFISVETHLPQNPWFCLDGKNTGKDSSQLEHQLFPTNISIEHGHLGMISRILTMIPVREDSEVVIIYRYPDIVDIPIGSMYVIYMVTFTINIPPMIIMV